MNPNRLLPLISFLVMCQLIRAAVINPNNTSPGKVSDKCSNYRNISLDFINIENFRSNVKQELKLLNCTRSGVVNVENPKKDSIVISSHHFCNSIPKNMPWRNSSLANFNHLTRIFSNYTLCIVVCTKDLNLTLWPYCETIRSLLAVPPEIPKPETKPSGSEAGPGVINDTNSFKNPKTIPENNQEVSVNSHKSPKNADDVTGSGKNQAINGGTSIEEGVNDPPNKGDINHGDESALDEELPINDLTRTNNSPDSGPNQKIEQQKTVDTSNQPGKLPPAPADVPNKPLALPVDTGTPNFRPQNDESHYFIYFVVMSILCTLCYIGIYNKKKILALVIEGRKQKDRRRHASAGYRKLNTNLEEVMPLGTSAPATDSMIY